MQDAMICLDAVEFARLLHCHQHRIPQWPVLLFIPWSLCRMRKVRSPAVVEPDHSNPGDPPPRSDKSPSEQENAPINAAPTHGVDVVLDSDDQLSDGDAARQANREDGEAGQRGPHKMDAVEVKEASDAEEGEVAA